MTLREELLLTLFALSRCEKFIIHLGVVESGHGSAIEPQGTGRKHQICSLKRGIALCSRFNELRIVFEYAAHGWILWEELWKFVVELHVIGNDDSNRCGHRFRYVARR